MLHNNTMSEIRDLFYHIFWQHKSCRNLFLLSKEELLDTKFIEIENTTATISFPRIILSNVSKNDETHNKIAIRSDKHAHGSEITIQNNIQYYTPIITNFIQNKFGKSFEKLRNDIEKKPIRFIIKVIKQLSGGGKSFEINTLKLLKEYHIVGNHINAFTELDEYIGKEVIQKNVKSIFKAEENVRDFLEMTKAIKDIYLNQLYRSLYNSDQILTNALHDTDNFEDRLNTMDLLLDAGIIDYTREDVFVECHHCKPGQYKGVLQIKIRPNHLKDLICPVCKKQLVYYVPYQIHDEIYQIIKSTDGVLLDAITNLLDGKRLKYEKNKKMLHDVEVDCYLYGIEFDYIIETKMYVIDDDPIKKGRKIKEHLSRLRKVAEQIAKSNPNRQCKSILVININKTETIKELVPTVPYDIEVLNIEGFREFVAKI
jgi:hypothetical protein